MHVSGEDHDARAQLLLLFLEIGAELLFRRGRAVSSAERLVIAGTCIRRVAHHDDFDILST
jgi:hypothetical protein